MAIKNLLERFKKGLARTDVFSAVRPPKKPRSLPKALTVKKGQSVKFIWRGKSMHNIIASKSGRRVWSIGTQVKGSATKRFTTRGTYKLLCSIHAPGMKMTITVR